MIWATSFGFCMGIKCPAPVTDLYFPWRNKDTALGRSTILYWDFFLLHYQNRTSQFFEQRPGIPAHATHKHCRLVFRAYRQVLNLLFFVFPCRILYTAPELLISNRKKAILILNKSGFALHFSSYLFFLSIWTQGMIFYTDFHRVEFFRQKNRSIRIMARAPCQKQRRQWWAL